MNKKRAHEAGPPDAHLRWQDELTVSEWVDLYKAIARFKEIAELRIAARRSREARFAKCGADDASSSAAGGNGGGPPDPGLTANRSTKAWLASAFTDGGKDLVP